MNIQHSLPINLDTFGFTEREKRKGRIIANRCGRDFLYYVLHYYFPEKFNAKKCGPVEIDRKKLFGIPMPGWLVWTCLPFYKVPSLFSENNIVLEINKHSINSFPSFIGSFIFPEYLSVDEAIRSIDLAIDNKQACGIDVSIALGGLIDHVMFVFGYDTDNFYVIDTHKVKKLEYEKLTLESDSRYIMKLSKNVVKKRWSRFSRVWIVGKITEQD